MLVWLWRRHSARYRAARTWLGCSTVIGLVGFTLLPTAPPRLLDASHGFVDTMAHYSSFGWWGGEASAPRGLGGLTNQFAAMPSLHVGWALWCGVLLWRHGRSPLLRAAGLLYPPAITFVVMGTANHYLLDVVAGTAVMGLGALLAPRAMRFADRARASWDRSGVRRLRARWLVGRQQAEPRAETDTAGTVVPPPGGGGRPAPLPDHRTCTRAGGGG